MSLGNLCSVKWLFDITSRTFIKISPPDFFHHINMFSRIPLLFGKIQASLVLTKTKISIFPRTSSFTWSNLFLKEFILEWPMTNLLLTFTRNFLAPKKKHIFGFTIMLFGTFHNFDSKSWVYGRNFYFYYYFMTFVSHFLPKFIPRIILLFKCERQHGYFY